MAFLLFDLILPVHQVLICFNPAVDLVAHLDKVVPPQHQQMFHLLLSVFLLQNLSILMELLLLLHILDLAQSINESIGIFLLGHELEVIRILLMIFD